MERQLVVAWYREDLSWLTEQGLNSEAVVYSKGGLEHPPNFTIFDLPNIGREAHTYLYHIVENYDNLADVTIFTQANPFDHSPDFCNLLPSVSSTHFTWLGIYPHPIYKQCLHNRQMYDRYLPDIAEGLNLIDKLPEVYFFQAGALFSVPKETILRHPKEFYQKGLTFFADDEPNDVSPAAHGYERLWEYIFN